MNFHDIAAPVKARFDAMTKLDLFCVDVSGDELWSRYLSSFPEGSNPIFRKRTEHDCTCCRRFIRDVGGVVAIKDGALISIWDIVVDEPAYQAVANSMSAFVKARSIKDPFLHYEKQVGTEKSVADIDGKIETFRHFYAQIPWAPNIGRSYFCAGKDIPTALGKARDLRNLFLRGLTELKPDAIDTVLELITEKSLYRGEQYEGSVKAFGEKLREFLALPEGQARELYAWVKYDKLHPPVAGIRNTAIGTLLIDLSEGMDVEQAVGRFEKTVAPENYQRPTSLVTESMVAKARDTIAQLGVLDSMERRHARLSDVSIENVLWADRSARKVMDGDIFDGVATKVSANVKHLANVETVGIDDFMRDILPRAESIEVMLENKHSGNLVSLIAPKHATAKPLFKWGNGFSWTYNGEVADSMRQKVIERGGRVDGVLRFTHMWNHIGRNASLMDLHVFMPGSKDHSEGCHDRYPSGRRIGWNQRNDFASGGVQDVDYVDAAPDGYVPVENITFPDLKRMPDGVYTFKIHNWRHRPPTLSGFSAQIAFGGNVYEFEHAAPLKHKEWVTLAQIELKKGQFHIVSMRENTQSSRTQWGLRTQDFHRVTTIMLSPNFWSEGNGTGNKHFFFMLDGTRNEDRPRGFFNEFLIDELSPHRKVIEIVGSKAKVEPSDDQLSGLGFSSTLRNDLLARVKGSINRTVRVAF